MTPREPETTGTAGAVSGAGTGTLLDALAGLRTPIRDARLPLDLPSARRAATDSARMLAQLDDYLLPRLARLDAPLLAVVGGPTGAGKSTLVNSLVRAPVSPAGVLRPTTRAPVLVCHPSDAAWFGSADLLPGLRRGWGAHPAPLPGTLRVVTAPALRPGIALLDAPDINSVVSANRELADQLLAAADMWLFVTTATRYADAVPLRVLRHARDRGVAVTIVLDRVPAGAESHVATDLGELFARQDLPAAPLFAVPEVALDGQGLLAEHLVAPLRQWLGRLAGDAAANAAVVRQTLGGAVDAVVAGVTRLADAAAEQLAVAATLTGAVEGAYAAAGVNVADAVRDGGLLRGEVVARWQEYIATGQLTRTMPTRAAWLWNLVLARVTGRPRPDPPLRAALAAALTALILEEADGAADRTRAIWLTSPAGAELLAAQRRAGTAAPAGADLTVRVEVLVRDWQRTVGDLVRGGARGRLGRRAYGPHTAELVVLLAVFAARELLLAGLDEAAGNVPVRVRAVLDAVLGDPAAHDVAGQARADLLRRVTALYDSERMRHTAVVAAAGPDPAAPDRLRDAAVAVSRAWRSAGLAGTAPVTLPAAPPVAPPAPAPAPPARSIFTLPPELADDYPRPPAPPTASGAAPASGAASAFGATGAFAAPGARGVPRPREDRDDGPARPGGDREDGTARRRAGR